MIYLKQYTRTDKFNLRALLNYEDFREISNEVGMRMTSLRTPQVLNQSSQRNPILLLG